jgi:hypothetical protein
MTAAELRPLPDIVPAVQSIKILLTLQATPATIVPEFRAPAPTRPIARTRSAIPSQAHRHELGFLTAISACEVDPEIIIDDPSALFWTCPHACALHPREDEDDVVRVDGFLPGCVGACAGEIGICF